MATETVTSLDLSRIGGYTVGVFALAFLVQGIAWSSTPLLFILISAMTAILFLGVREHRAKLPFFLIPLGPLINLVVLHRDPYLYNIEAVLLTYFTFWFLSGHGQVSRISLTWTSSFYLLFIFVVFTSTVVHMFSGDDPLSEIRLVRGFAIGFLLFLFLGCVGDRLNSFLPDVFRATLLSFAVVALSGIAEYAIGVIRGQTWLTEPKSVFDGSESLAIYLVTMLPLILGFTSLQNYRVYTLAGMFTGTAGLVTLIATRSRAGLMAVFVYCIGNLLSGKNQKQRLAGALLILVLAGTVLWIIMAKSGLLQTKAFPELGRGASMIFSSRINPWSEGLSTIFSSPIWGHGAYKNVYNVFLQIGTQFGGLAMLAFIIFLMATWVKGKPCKTFIRSPESLRTSIFWSITTLLIISLGESTLGNQHGYIFWFLIHLSGYFTEQPLRIS